MSWILSFAALLGAGFAWLTGHEARRVARENAASLTDVNKELRRIKSAEAELLEMKVAREQFAASLVLTEDGVYSRADDPDGPRYCPHCHVDRRASQIERDGDNWYCGKCRRTVGKPRAILALPGDTEIEPPWRP